MSNKTYTYEEVKAESVKYFNGDELAAEVFAGKYALRDMNGKIYELTPTDMHKRLAKEFARIEMKYANPLSEEEIFNLLSSWKIVPQGSPMSAMGNPFQFQSLSNCFVIESPEDSYGGILRADQEEAQIMKRRGGVGFDISKIRPKGLNTSNAARTTDGIGVFMERFSNTCREVAQGGRRGALMLSISVHHPEIRTFINIKKDLKKVTGANISIRLSDEFMNAVKNKTNVQLRFPIEKNVEHLIEQEINAEELWNEIIEAAHASAEPGLLFWDTITNMGPADAYNNYKSTSTNPCLTGDTKIAVADGRGYVSIKDLADSNNDIPVYTVDNNGKLVVRLMRHPRKTGDKKPVFKITIEGGHSFKATANHKMIMKDGTEKRVDTLMPGDQLWTSYRVAAKFNEVLPGYKATQSQNYWWIKDCNHHSWKTEHRLIWEYVNGKVPKNHVIHHIDFNGLNNSINNLLLMSKLDHDQYHANLIRGKNNPMVKMQMDPIKLLNYSNNMSLITTGIKNGNAYKEISNDDIKNHLKMLTINFGRRVSINEWHKYAEKNKLPKTFSNWRKNELGNFYNLSINIARQCGILNSESDPRLQKTLLSAIEQGYEADIINNEVIISRNCEWCLNEFTNSWNKREIAFCSHSCSNYYTNKINNNNLKRVKSLQNMHALNAEKSKKNILDVYTELRSILNREPFQYEVKELCKERNYSYRTGTKNGFKNWKDIQHQAETYNHRILKIEFFGYEDVYNGTVDEFHNLCMVLGEEKLNNFNNLAQLIIASKQCGEITLSPYDSCRLLLLNLFKFVKNPFEKNAKFDYDDFKNTAYKAQKLMDDLVDLELEAIDKIIDKIKSDPESDEVKQTELILWNKIKKAAIGGRRTGLGITALGDTLAAINVQYGSEESIKITENIYKTQALAAYSSTVDMAKERGTFPVFSHEIENNHPFIDRIINEDSELKRKYKKYGRRNIALTTTAPAGSVSILTQTTSGCEPAFMLFYKRRRKITTNDENSRVDFIDNMGDKWQEYTVYHHAFKQWMNITGLTEEDINKSPYWKSISNDINWVNKINVQAAAQKWICHSISNTTNIPNETSIDIVKQIYMHGWVSGCKGVTIYRDGSRAGVLVSNEPQKTIDEFGQPFDILESHAPKRPKELICDIHRATIKGETYLVLVGLHNNKPYEIFCGLQQHVEVPKKVKSGILIKNGKIDGIATYNLKIPLGDDDEIVFNNVVELFQNPIYGALTRTISLAMRHGVPLQFLMEQLKKDKHSDITSFSSVIARVLGKHYIADGTKVTIEKTCSECNGNNIQYMQGCVTCFDCGNSKCG